MSDSPPSITEIAAGFTPQAIVLDVDGTLIDHELHLHPRARDAVLAAGAVLPVVIATGRMYRSVLPWAQELGITQPLVCYQGAVVREVAAERGDGAVIFEEGLGAAAALEVVETARAHGWHVQAYQDDQLLCDQDRPEAHLYARIAQVPIHFVDDLAAIVRAGSTKVVCVIQDPDGVEECVGVLTAELGERARVTRSIGEFVEVVSPRVNKAHAVDIVLARLGLHLADAVAVGDAPNDAEMLAGAGLGVAVEGARREVLAAADATCAGPAAAGVADVLEHLGVKR